jgi:tricorn protease
MELLNGDIKYGIPQLGARDQETGWYENSEVVPDLLVFNTPDEVAAGHDAQLEASVQRLLKDLPQKGPP